MSSESTGMMKRIQDHFSSTFEINCLGKVKFFVSEFSLIVIMALIILLIDVIPQYHSKKTFTSKQIPNFQFSQDPIILVHTTDIHMSVNRKERTDGSSIILMSLCEYNPDLFLLNGDYVDNSKKGGRMGKQNLEEWKMYKSTVINVLFKKGFKVIDISGNHDQWAVGEVNSKENNFLDNSFIYNRTNVKDELDFYLRKIKLNINNIDINFLLIHDYRYPVYRPPYGSETHTSVKQLDLLENMINSIDEEEIFLMSHYPVDRALIYKSHNGLTFGEIISNKKVYAIFTGHEHPHNVRIIHHGDKGGLEFCTASPFDNKRAGLITLDNGNLVYHEVYIPYYGNKPLFFLTYPTPNEQLSSHHIFNIKNFDIRVISYYPHENIKLIIEGDINGFLEYDHTLNNGAFLYKYHVDLEEGEYKIHIFDENNIGCDISTEFTIGEKYTGKKEKFIGGINYRFALRFMIIPFFIFLFIIAFPFFPELNLNIVKSIEKNIECQIIDNKLNPILIYILLIVLSPFFYRLRLQSTSQINKIIRYAIFIALIYPLILPVHFMQSVEGKIGYSFFAFVVLDNKANYESWAIQMTFIYYGITLFPFILFASGKKFYNKNNKIIIIIHSVLCLIMWIGSFIINFLTVGQSLSLGYLFFSTAFVIIFIVLLILFIIYFCK